MWNRSIGSLDQLYYLNSLLTDSSVSSESIKTSFISALAQPVRKTPGIYMIEACACITCFWKQVERQGTEEIVQHFALLVLFDASAKWAKYRATQLKI